VPSLTAQHVTITDGSGTLVWPSGGAGDAGTKAAAEASRAQATEARLNAVLDQTLGANKAKVQVNYDLNMDKVSQEKLAYDAEGVPLRDEQSGESLKGTGSVPSGSSGSQGNVPGYSASTGSAGGNNDYKQTSKKVDYGVGKTITKTDVAAGAIKKMQVGLILDSKLKYDAATQKSLESMIGSAAGIDSARGDTINTTVVDFPKVEEVAGSPVPAGMLGALKGIAIAIAAMLFLFFLSRYLKSREADVLMDEPSWLKQLPRPATTAVGPAPDVEMITAMTQIQEGAAKSFASDPRKKALQDVVDNEPDRVAAHLRSWITEDGV
jgi:flagellar M-ring protein FliF